MICEAASKFLDTVGGGFKYVFMFTLTSNLTHIFSDRVGWKHQLDIFGVSGWFQLHLTKFIASWAVFVSPCFGCLISGMNHYPIIYIDIIKRQCPGDSKWPFHPLVGGHLTPKKGQLTIPKRSLWITRVRMPINQSVEWNVIRNLNAARLFKPDLFALRTI